MISPFVFIEAATRAQIIAQAAVLMHLENFRRDQIDAVARSDALSAEAEMQHKIYQQRLGA